MAKIDIPLPEIQIQFSFALGRIRSLYLQEALCDTVAGLNIQVLDRELAHYVPASHLNLLARHGLRGELVFPVPCLLAKNPYLLGYYRLLLGFSQKEFYTKFGASRFKSMETKGVLSKANEQALPELCKGLIHSAVALVDGIGGDRISKAFLDDLTLLTVGPQLRGGVNVRKGIEGIVDVFKVVHDIVAHAATRSSANRIEIGNAAGRQVLIEFAPDPDIVIREEISPGRYRNIVAIEVKSGTDFSNIHNRLGEAEKSHQKARAAGYVECWTVVNVDRIDLTQARQESPSTNKFYCLSALKSRTGVEYDDFRDSLLSLVGIAAV